MSFEMQVSPITEAKGVGARALRALGVALALGCALPAGALAAPNETVVSSRTTGSGPPDATLPSRRPAVSGDGRFVAFLSNSRRLALDDPTPNGGPTDPPDVYVRDHLNNVTTTVSVGSTSGVDSTSSPSISADGRYVLFAATTNLLAPDGGSPLQSRTRIFVRDLQGPATVEYVGVGSSEGASGSPSTISADGRYAVFSTPRNANQEGGAADVFVRDLQSDTTTLVAAGRAESISADGRYITFNSSASDLVADDTNGQPDVFVRDRKGTPATADDTTTLVSRTGDGTPGDGSSRGSSISDDGRFVAFSSAAPNLTGGNGQRPVLVRDLRAETTTLVSQARDGAAASAAFPSISGDGRFVAFRSQSNDLVEGDTNANLDVFVRDLQERTTVVASRSSGAGAPDGDRGAFGGLGASPISRDGRFVAFDSDSTNLVAGDTNGQTDVFRRELAAAPARPSVSVADVSVAEGDAGTVDAVFTLTLSRPSGQAVLVDVATADDTASAPGGDYQAKSETVTIAAGQMSKTVAVKVNGDILQEPDERFLVNLTKPDGATIADGQGVGTITNDDQAAPAVSIADASVSEPNSGEAVAVFAVTLSGASGRAVSVDFATADGTATAPSDYVSKTGTVQFAAGETAKTVAVAVQGDTVAEADEQFFVRLANVQAATVADGEAVGTIIDNDQVGMGPRVSVSDASVIEGDSGPVLASFEVSIPAASGSDVSVDLATADDTARAPGDYAAKSERVTIAAGQTSTRVAVAVNGDRLDELDERFFVNLANPSAGATLGGGQGVGSIQDDDDAPSLSVADATVTEGDAGDVSASFDVSLSGPSGRPVTVDVATADGTATAPDDYAAKSVGVTFAPGETSKAVIVQVKGDLLDEADERFLVDLSGPAGATLGDAQGAGTIVDNDAPPVLSIDDRIVAEGDTGKSDAVFGVSLSAASGRAVTVDLATADQSAVAPEDYDARSLTVTFAPGELSKAVVVRVNGDTRDEPDERFLVNLEGVRDATLADRQGVGTITDDDPPAAEQPPAGEGSQTGSPPAGGGPPPAASAGVAPTGPLPVTPAGDATCVGFSPGVAAGRLGLARLGTIRQRQRAIFGGARRTSRGQVDRWCVAGGGLLRVAYPTVRVLGSLSRPERTRVGNRAVLLLTTSRRYSIGAIRPGTSVGVLRRQLKGERAYRVGGVTWYLASRGSSRLAFRTRGGRVLDIGFIDKRLTSSSRLAKRILGSWVL